MGPGLDVGEVEEGVAGGGAGPYRVGVRDASEVDKAGGGGEVRKDLIFERSTVEECRR